MNQGFPVVDIILQNHYCGLLGEQEIQRCSIVPQVMSLGNTLTIDQQLTLCAPFSESEIKDAMFSIPNTKSPSPDGYSSGFFKSWHLIGGLVKDAIQHFFQKGIMPSFLAKTKLILLAKVQNPA